MRQHDFLPDPLSHHNTKVLVCRLDPHEMTQLQSAVNVGAVACTWLSHSISISEGCVFPCSAKMLKSKVPPLLIVLGLLSPCFFPSMERIIYASYIACGSETRSRCPHTDTSSLLLIL